MERIASRWNIFYAIILLLGAGWIGLTAAMAPPTTGGQTPAPRENFLAPDFTLQQLNAGSTQLSQQVGNVVILNIWASWCPPCKAEMPALERVFRDYQDQGLTILAVNATHQDDPSAVTKFITEQNLTFPILLDPGGEVSRSYEVRALPTTFFIDRQGIIRRVVVGGPMSEALLRSEVSHLLEGAP